MQPVVLDEFDESMEDSELLNDYFRTDNECCCTPNSSTVVIKTIVDYAMEFTTAAQNPPPVQNRRHGIDTALSKWTSQGS